MIGAFFITPITGFGVEINGIVYGPFDNKETALGWALRQSQPPFKIHPFMDPRMRTPDVDIDDDE